MIRAVVLEDLLPPATRPSLADVVLAEEFELTTAETDWVMIAAQFAQDVSGRVANLNLDRVAIRGADQHQSRRLTTGVSLRLFVEGAISAAAKSQARTVAYRSGANCAQAYGSDKGAMDADARGLVTRANSAEAAAAALSALVEDRA
ncbi:MAG: hypothetical protein QM598_04190 [Protaetiibacter sp.]